MDLPGGGRRRTPREIQGRFEWNRGERTTGGRRRTGMRRGPRKTRDEERERAGPLSFSFSLLLFSTRRLGLLTSQRRFEQANRHSQASHPSVTPWWDQVAARPGREIRMGGRREVGKGSGATGPVLIRPRPIQLISECGSCFISYRARCNFPLFLSRSLRVSLIRRRQ